MYTVIIEQIVLSSYAGNNSICISGCSLEAFMVSSVSSNKKIAWHDLRRLVDLMVRWGQQSSSDL